MQRSGIKESFLTAMLLILTALCGCGQTGGRVVSEEPEESGIPEVTIRFAWWGSEERARRTVEAVRLFEEKNPGIRVRTSWFDFDSYGENLRIAASVGNLPDVFQGYIGADNDYMARGLVECLDSYVDEGLICTDDIPEELLESGKIGGRLYGLSMGCNVKCLVVDVKAYDKAGLTIPGIAYPSWEALADDLRLLKEATGQYGADDLFDKSFMLEYFVRQQGGHYFSRQTGGIAFSLEAFKEFYTLKKSWAREGLIPPYDAEASTALEDSRLVLGEAAVRFCYSNELLELAGLSGRELKLLLLPGAANGMGTDIRPGIHISMSSGSQQKEAAAKLIDFLINDVEANRILNAERGIPVSGKVREEIVADFDEIRKEMLEIVNQAEKYSAPPEPAPAFDTLAYDRFLKEIEEEIMYGHVSMEEAYGKVKEYEGRVLGK